VKINGLNRIPLDCQSRGMPNGAEMLPQELAKHSSFKDF